MTGDKGVKRVLWTRPTAGIEAKLPVLSLSEVRVDYWPLITIINQVPTFSPLCYRKPAAYLIFTSPQAVKAWFAYDQSPDLVHAQVCAVGRGTAEALFAFGVKKVLYPVHEAGAKALLTLLPSGELTEQTVVIVCGAQHNRWLNKKLQLLGAQVVEAVCYRQLPPKPMPSPVADTLQGIGYDAIVLTSLLSAKYLQQKVPLAWWPCIQRTLLTATSEKMVDWLQQQGCRQIRCLNPNELNIVSVVKRVLHA